MRILVLNGSPRVNGNTSAMVDAFKKGAESVGHNVVVNQVGVKQIHDCIGCEYCHTKGNGKCFRDDDMGDVIKELQLADVLVLASPIYYFSITSYLQSAIDRIYSIQAPKAKKFALILSSHSNNVYSAAIDQYNKIVAFFGGENLGIITAHHDENKTNKKLQEVYDFAKSLS